MRGHQSCRCDQAYGPRNFPGPRIGYGRRTFSTRALLLFEPEQRQGCRFRREPARLSGSSDIAVKLLMCPPTYYGIEYEINPWMSRGRQSDSQRAQQQWQQLRELLS